MKNYDEMRKNFFDAASFKEPEKVPVGVTFMGWPFCYAGVRYQDIMHDPAACAEAYLKIFDDIEVDWAQTAMLPWPIEVWQSMGSDAYEFGSDGNCVTHAQARENLFKDASIYPEIVKDAKRFINETYLKQVIPAFSWPEEDAYRALIKALQSMKPYMAANMMIGQGIRERGIYSMNDDNKMQLHSSFMKIFSFYRGIAGAMRDLRKHPEEVRAAVYAIDAYKDEFETVKAEDLEEGHYISYSIYHAEGGFLRPEQYDDFYLNRVEKVITPLLEKGLKHYIYVEGNCMSNVEHLRRLPKGSVILHLDTEDPFEVYKLVGDVVTLACGIPTTMLAASTPDECRDYVKKCFDTFAPGGGFVFAPSNMICSDHDARIENVIAVYETANELSRKH